MAGIKEVFTNPHSPFAQLTWSSERYALELIKNCGPSAHDAKTLWATSCKQIVASEFIARLLDPYAIDPKLLEVFRECQISS